MPTEEEERMGRSFLKISFIIGDIDFSLSSSERLTPPFYALNP